ncbi:hypothetical protein RP20_CCG011412 [Aedes albopictus]|nr:hypothetical protein RP20_CCG011412 [Aedes albopictus]
MTNAYDIFSGVCVFVVSVQLLRKVFPWIYENLLGPKLFGSAVKLREMGSWALVTGATDGIGKAYAKALAKKGLNIVLVSRTQSKLEKVAKEIENEFKTTTKIIAVDFTSGPEIYKTIAQQTAGLEIGVLINNVAMCYDIPERFLQLPDQDKLTTDLVTCNVISVTHMCSLVLPGMVNRRKGVIINISSVSSVIPSPMLAVYAATKAFVTKFSNDLATEYARHGVLIQAVLPGPVATNMSKIRKSTWLACSPQKFVGDALRTLGIARQTTGYYPHALIQKIMDALEFLSPTGARLVTLKTLEHARAEAHRLTANE